MSDEAYRTGAGDLPESSVSIVPGVSILGVLGHLNYDPWFALAEYVDNSIQSASKSLVQLVQGDPSYRLKVSISYERENGGRIVIEDNAAGIARDDFGRAFRAAEVPPDRTGLSEFGMGMKSASIWFARNWRVVTTSVGDPLIYAVEFDMDAVLANNVERLEISSESGSVEQHFTRIELWNLNQFLPGRTMGKVRDHLREIYRGFLRDNRLVLSVGGSTMVYEEADVLIAQDYRVGTTEGIRDEFQEWKKSVDFALDGGAQIRGWAAIRAEGKTSGNGLSLFRRGRVIVGSGESPYRPARIYGQGNSYRSQRLFGELEIVGLPVSHTKDGFQWLGNEEQFEERLRTALDSDPLPLLKQAEHYRARQASKAEQKRIREATENTADAAERAIPEALDDVLRQSESSEVMEPETATESGEIDTPQDVVRQFEFPHSGKVWRFSITTSSRPAESRWLIRHVEVEPRTGDLSASLTVNTAHAFLRQFALGSTDALEAVLRMSVALVVSETVLQSAGDGETAAAFMRQIDAMLGSTLAKRIKDGT